MSALGTGSRQILVTFYQVLTCRWFSFTPLQGAADLLQAALRHGAAGCCSRQHPHQSIPRSSAWAHGLRRELRALAEGCWGLHVWHEGWRGARLGNEQRETPKGAGHGQPRKGWERRGADGGMELLPAPLPAMGCLEAAHPPAAPCGRPCPGLVLTSHSWGPGSTPGVQVPPHIVLWLLPLLWSWPCPAFWPWPTLALLSPRGSPTAARGVPMHQLWGWASGASGSPGPPGWWHRSPRVVA